MLGIQTDNGRFLVKTEDGQAIYTDAEGNFLRTANDAEQEWQWALETWKHPKIDEMSEEFEKNLMGQLKYIVR
jgi:hypothetical protein